MPEEKVLPKDRIASSFKNLAAVSTEIDSAAKELGASIASLDDALERLNLGVSAWHRIAGGEDHETGNYWHRDIGYTQVSHRWQISLRRAAGNEFSDDYGEEIWTFNQAPYWMRIESIGKLPDLFDELIKRTIETTQKIKARTTETEELAAAVRAAYGEIFQPAAKKARK